MPRKVSTKERGVKQFLNTEIPLSISFDKRSLLVNEILESKRFSNMFQITQLVTEPGLEPGL